MRTRNHAPASATRMAADVRAGDARPIDLVNRSLERVRQIGGLNAFVLVDRDGARTAAAESEARLANGSCGALEGVPVAIKDFTPTRGHLTTRGSWSTGNWIPDSDPVIVQRLKAAGAIVIGKTTTPEFAFAGHTRSPRWGITRNPHNPEHTPGGSSGGSACAVASGCVPLAEGTDMGGSVRAPAALCGVVGLKPSIGRIPMDILPTVFDSLSHFGPLATCIDDAALFLSVTQGPHDADIQSQPRPEPIELPVPAEVGGLRVALSTDLGYYGVDPEITARIEQAADSLARRGARVERVEPDWSRKINDTWGELWAVSLAAAWGDRLPAFRERMDPDLVALMESARNKRAVAYKRIETWRSRLWHDLRTVLGSRDALLCPTCATIAPSVDTSDTDFEVDLPDGRYVGFDMCCPFNLVPQCPALSVPVGVVRDLPVGLQVVGRRFADQQVLRIAKAIEMAYPPVALDASCPALSPTF